MWEILKIGHLRNRGTMLRSHDHELHKFNLIIRTLLAGFNYAALRSKYCLYLGRVCL